MYDRQEARDAGNGVYLANFTTGTQMHYGIRDEVDPPVDTSETLRDSKHFKKKKKKSITYLVHPLPLIRAAVRATQTCTPLTFGTLMPRQRHIRKIDDMTISHI